MSSYMNRIMRAAKLDVSLYEEVEADKNAMGQAMGVVVLSSIAAGIGSVGLGGFKGLFTGTLVALVGWYVWAYLAYFIGTKLLPEEQTRADHGELLRTIGFSSAPGMLRIFGIIPIPGLGNIIQLIASVWMLIAMVIAVRQALDYESWRLYHRLGYSGGSVRIILCNIPLNMINNSINNTRIKSFNFPPGKIIGRKYEVVSLLGQGWEGEVYLIRERSTGIERTAKVFYPQRNIKDKTAMFNAKKLHKLRRCSIVIPYHAQEMVTFRKFKASCLISEYVEGELLSHFLDRQPGKRLSPFQALHLLYALSSGVDQIHRLREYHGDLHSDNIIVHRLGLGFELKLIDLFYWKIPKKELIQEEVCDMIRIFYDSLGGARWYAKQPKEVKDICCGLKRSLISKKFRSAGQLKIYLETMRWSS
jgi:tRNA A-37 threonylcarbamoyl transferase component Bud32